MYSPREDGAVATEYIGKPASLIATIVPKVASVTTEVLTGIARGSEEDELVV